MGATKPTRRPQSKGQCVYCGAAYARAGMSKHLLTCPKRLAAIERADQQSKSKPKRWFHLLVADAYSPDYWLHLEMDAAKKLADLDQFLRDIWLECCGHLSRFTIEGQGYSSYPMEDFDERDLAITLDKVLSVGLEFQHEYDYGTTTDLTLKVIGEREGAALEKRWLNILARNNPPEYTCGYCHQKPATLICSYCGWGSDEALVCEDCKTKHPCYVEEGDDYMFLPLVNSPRTGMCGYSGSELYP